MRASGFLTAFLAVITSVEAFAPTLMEKKSFCRLDSMAQFSTTEKVGRTASSIGTAMSGYAALKTFDNKKISLCVVVDGRAGHLVW